MNDGVKKGVSRTNHVAKNILWAIINQAMMIALSLISRKIFLNVLGAELLGANSLFSDVISLFSFADLGFGTAVVFSLYKPIAENDQIKIKSLLQYDLSLCNNCADSNSFSICPISSELKNYNTFGTINILLFFISSQLCFGLCMRI